MRTEISEHKNSCGHFSREAAITHLFMHITTDPEAKKTVHRILQNNPEGDYEILCQNSTFSTGLHGEKMIIVEKVPGSHVKPATNQDIAQQTVGDHVRSVPGLSIRRRNVSLKMLRPRLRS